MVTPSTSSKTQYLYMTFRPHGDLNNHLQTNHIFICDDKPISSNDMIHILNFNITQKAIFNM